MTHLLNVNTEMAENLFFPSGFNSFLNPILHLPHSNAECAVVYTPALYSRTNISFETLTPLSGTRAASQGRESVGPHQQAEAGHGSCCGLWTTACWKVMAIILKHTEPELPEEVLRRHAAHDWFETAPFPGWTLRRQNIRNPHAGRSLQTNMWLSLL